MKSASAPRPAASSLHDRILGVAFEAFTGEGYAATSTLEIAKRAKVSKRDLYATFGSKQAVLVACIKRRVERMRLLPDLPVPSDRRMLASTLAAFATNVINETANPSVIAAFRLGVAEVSRAPEIAQALDTAGRGAARHALAQLLGNAQASGLMEAGDPAEMAVQFFGLLWEGLLVGLLLGVARAPSPAEASFRAEKAVAAFLRLYPEPSGRPSRSADPVAPKGA